MIKTIEIHNFQSLEDVLLELDPNGVNVFIGPTDSGKSALFRALDLLFRNVPQGWDYRSWFYEQRIPTTVRVVSDMDDEVVRMKGGNVNKYIINGEDWAASSIPPALTNLFPVNISNFQPQHKPYFLLQDTPGTVGSRFSEIVGLHIIDSVTSSAESRVRTLRQTKTRLKEDIDDLKSKVRRFAALDAMENILRSAQGTKELLEHNIAQVDAIAPLIDQISAKQDVIQSQNQVINEVEPQLNAVIETLNAAVDASESRHLRRAIGLYVEIDAQLQRETQIIDTLEPLYNAMSGTISDLHVVIIEAELLNNKTYNMQRLLDLITTDSLLIHEYETFIQESIERIGYCPLCGDAKGVGSEDSDIGGLAHTCDQTQEEGGQLCGNASGQSSLPVRHRTRRPVQIHHPAGGPH